MAGIVGLTELQHTNGTSAATIDASGRILTPARPAFRVEKRASNQTLSDSTDAKVTFEHEVFDIGANFASDKFTAPITGIYSFQTLLRCVADGGSMDYAKIMIYRNGALYCDLIQMHTAANQMMNSHLGGSVLMQLTASQYVEIYIQLSGANPLIHAHASGQRTWFSGFLVG